MRIVEDWWPLPAVVTVVIAVQVWWSSTFDLPGGHGSDHFMNASAIFGFTVAVTLLIWALPQEERRYPVLWLLGAAILASALVVTVANVRVVNAIGSSNWTDAEAAALGPTRPGFVAGHEAAERAGLALTITSSLLALWLGWRKALHLGLVVVAAVANVLGGMGVFLLAAAAVIGRARRLRVSCADQPATTVAER